MSRETHIVSRLFILITLFIRHGLVLIGFALLLAEGLPLLSEDLADLAFTENQHIVHLHLVVQGWTGEEK